MERQKTWIREDEGDWNEFKKPPFKWMASRFWLVENSNLVVRDWILCCLYLWGFHKWGKCWVQMDNLNLIWGCPVQEFLAAATPRSLKRRDTRERRSWWPEWKWIHLFYSDRLTVQLTNLAAQTGSYSHAEVPVTDNVTCKIEIRV